MDGLNESKDWMNEDHYKLSDKNLVKVVNKENKIDDDIPLQSSYCGSICNNSGIGGSNNNDTKGGAGCLVYVIFFVYNPGEGLNQV